MNFLFKGKLKIVSIVIGIFYSIFVINNLILINEFKKLMKLVIKKEKDVKPLNYISDTKSDMKAKTIFINHKENSFFNMPSINSEYESAIKTVLKEKGLYNISRRVSKKNRDAIKHFKEKTFNESIDINKLISYTEVRKNFKQWILYMLYEIHNKNYDKAVDILIATYGISSHFENDERVMGNLIDKAISIAVSRGTTFAGLYLLDNYKIENRDIIKIIKSFNKISKYLMTIKRAVEIEYNALINTKRFSKVYSDRVKSVFNDEKLMRSVLDKFFMPQIIAMDISFKDAKNVMAKGKKLIEKHVNRIGRGGFSYLSTFGNTKKAIVNIIASIAVPNIERSYLNYMNTKTYSKMIILRAFLKLYNNKKSKYPKSLKSFKKFIKKLDLISKDDVKSLFIDPYTDNQLYYTNKNGIVKLISCGENMINDYGVFESDDIGFQINY